MRLCIPVTDHCELEEIAQVLSTGYLTQGPKAAQFEHLVADLIGSRYAFATSSCTTALHLSLAALGIGQGDEVLVADFTFPATANAVIQQGAIPVLVDTELDTFTVCIDDLLQKITGRTKAIIPVHTFGCPADMDAIVEAASRRGIAVIEDAACALGATYKGRYCGNLGTLGCFSFHPRKVITTGEGGMIATNDADLAARIQLLRSHGGVRTGHWYSYEAAGYNYRLSDIQGAIGVAQMAKLPKLIARRRVLARQLGERLRDIRGVRPPLEPRWGGHIFQSYVVLVDEAIDRDAIIETLHAEGIEATLGTYALHDQPLYQRQYGYVTGQLPGSHAAYMRTITLPFYPQMGEADLDAIAVALGKAVAAQPAADLNSREKCIIRAQKGRGGGRSERHMRRL